MLLNLIKRLILYNDLKIMVDKWPFYTAITKYLRSPVIKYRLYRTLYTTIMYSNNIINRFNYHIILSSIDLYM